MSALRVAFVAHPCRLGGAYMGAINYLRGLARIASDEQYLVFCPPGCGYEDVPLPSGSRFFVYEGRHHPLARWQFERFCVPKRIAEFKADVVLAFANYGIRKAPAPQAVYVHQAYLFYPSRHYPHVPLYDRYRYRQLRALVRRTLPATQRVLCQTPVVRDRFAAEYGFPVDRIRIAPWAAPDEVRRPAADAVPDVFRDRDAFHMLLMTRYQSHRNPGLLVPLCRKHGDVFRRERIRFITCVTPADDPRASTFLREIASPDLADLIVNVGALSREQVPRYLAAADVLWLPTLLETLCLPWLEAMTVGTPILAPDLDFARYVCGDAALYYDPWTPESVFGAILKIRTDAALRSGLVEKGRRQAACPDRFAPTWDEAARILLDNLRDLAGKGAR